MQLRSPRSTTWKVGSSAVLISLTLSFSFFTTTLSRASSYPVLGNLSLSLSLPLSLSTPLLLSSSYSQPGKFIFSRVEAFSISFSKACRKGSSVAILGPFAFASPTSELYTQYIMNIAISRRSYTVRSFLKWKTARKVGRGLKVTLLLLDSPTLESSYRLSSSRVPLGQHSQL